MSNLRRNVVANAVGRGWTALTAFAFVPVYLRFVGVEGYGLIAFFTALVALSNMLDLGISTTLNREMARHAGSDRGIDSARDLLRTLEIVYWLLALLLGTAIAALSSFLARNWLGTTAIQESTVRGAVLLMGMALMFHWPGSLYSGGLMGLQRHVLLNSIVVVTMTVRTVGAALVLWLVSPTITAFFAWQLLVSLLHTAVVRIALWRSLPGGSRPPGFRRHLLVRVWRFAAGIGAASLLGVVLTQLDKVVLSRMVSLTEFGYYGVVSLATAGMAYLALPLFEAVYPRLSTLVAAGKDVSVNRLFHKATQLIAVVVLPPAAVIAVFAFEFVELWTGNPTIASNTHLILALLIIGAALNALMQVPYALMLAHGWTSLPMALNLGAVVLLGPSLIVAINRYGTVGAAMVWLVLNVGYLLVGAPLMYRRLLASERRQWFRHAVAAPVAAVAGVSLLSRAMPFGGLSGPSTFVWLAVTMVVAAGAAVLVTPEPRAWVGQIGIRRAFTR